MMKIKIFLDQKTPNQLTLEKLQSDFPGYLFHFQQKEDFDIDLYSLDKAQKLKQINIQDNYSNWSNEFDDLTKTLYLLRFKKLPTQDGSSTLFSARFNESLHSITGAIEETKFHYVQGCDVELKLSTQEKVTLLEVGFGAGIGFFCTKEVVKPNHHLHYISLEQDKSLIEDTLQQKQIRYIDDGDKYKVELENILLEIYYGDARESIFKINQYFDVIYQDAFSPKRNPTLWTVEWFEQLAKRSYDKTIMSTYSASKSIRKSMIAAGWKIYEGGAFKRKRSSTRAKRIGESEQSILEELERSPVQALNDKDLKG